MTHPTGNRELIRAINRSHVLNAIKTHGPIGRADIARRTGLKPGNRNIHICEIDLSKPGLWKNQPGISTGGRPPISLVINPKGGYVVGIKLTENNAICALTDLEATVIAKSSVLLSGDNPQRVVDDLAHMVTVIIRENKISKKQLLGVGVGLAGIVDADEGILRQSPIYGWENLSLYVKCFIVN